MPVRGSPRLIAAYHVLHRLSAPRHPPDTLMTRDRPHHRCPPGETESSHPARRHRRSAPSRDRAAVHPQGGPKTFASKHVRDGMRSSFPSPGPSAPPVSRQGKTKTPIRPLGSGPPRHAGAARPPGRTRSLFTMSNITPGHKPDDAPRGRSRRRILKVRTSPIGARGRDVLRGQGSLDRLGFPRPTTGGGARRDRTDDLMLAKHALSQLSYCPEPEGRQGREAKAVQPRPNAHDRLVGLGRLELPTSRLSSARSNQLSYKPERPSHEGQAVRPLKKEKRRRRQSAKGGRDCGPMI